MRTETRQQSLRTRKFIDWQEWDGHHTSRGSFYIGSWRGLEGFYTKTITLISTQSGSIHIITSQRGRDAETGTYYTARIEAGSYTTKSWTEAIKEARVIMEVSGSSTTGKGTLDVNWGGQT